MKKQILHIIFLCFGLLMLASCRNFEQKAQHFQMQLEAEATEAMQITEQVHHALTSGAIDSVLQITKHDHILFYIFDRHGLAYWSNNWLAAEHVDLRHFDKWDLYQFDNAITIARWTHADNFNILTVVPIKYAYSFENQQLHNEFIPPFDLPKTIGIRRFREADDHSISLDGKYVFSLYEGDETDIVPAEDTRLKDSFTYGTVLTNKRPHHQEVHYYTIIAMGFIGIILLLAIVGLFRFGGIRNMSLGMRFQYLIASLLLSIFTFVFLTSLWFVTKKSEKQQVEKLENITRYIQKSMQDLYYNSYPLTEYNSQSLNINLRDICYAYETDIHVYDLNGYLIGSSSPSVFDKGIISRRMATEPLSQQQFPTITRERIGDMEYLSSYDMLYNDSYLPIGYIQVPFYEAEDATHLALDDFLAILFPPYIILMLLSLMFGMFSSRRLTLPLTSFTESLKSFRKGQINAHLDYKRHDEVGELAHEYNLLIDELQESTEKLARSEREVAWRTMARQIAHEINNPLTPMKLQIQQLQRLKQQEDERFDSFFNRSTSALIEQIDNLSRIASSFSSFAKMPEVHTSQVDIAVQLSSVITLFRTNTEHIPVRYIGAEYGVEAKADGEQIRQVFTNIIKNAIQAIGEKKNADIIVVLKELEKHVEISISDNGPGIPDEVKDKIFMPNFTTKSTGTGLGLAISKNIVEGSGGTISFKTSPKGTTFYITLRR